MSKDQFVLLHIYGDNIIECERALELILLGFKTNEIAYKTLLLKDNLISPVFKILTSSNNYLIKLFPGTQRSRWNKDIYTDFILNKGGVISEGADAIITRFNDKKEEEVLLGIEFSAALPAGNNAWQRSGRAYSFSLVGIPYFYVCEFGGNELNKKGDKKASRFPNPAVILSYILNSQRNEVPNMLVYQQSPVASSEIISNFKDLLDGNVDLSNIIYSILVNNNKEEIYLQKIVNKNIQIMNNISVQQKNTDIKSEVLKKIEDIDFDNAIELVKLEKRTWKKKYMKSKYHPTVSELFDSLSNNCYGIFSKDLPFSLLSTEKKQQFLNDLKQIYPENSIKTVSEWLTGKDDVAICFINGFKPGGEDSRPDRGLIPFTRMLVGEDVPILSIIFGPVPFHFYDRLDNDIEKVALSNGLWSTIINFSNAIFIDSKTLPIYEPKTYIIDSKKEDTSISPEIVKNIAINFYPNKFGENDVDTLIHLFFSRLIDNVFESFCNPPGGDWSGISILNGDYENRFVSLPRLSNKSKRPDHVYQFKHDQQSVLLAIESKETLASLINEKEVGHFMNVYLQDLLNRTVNAKRIIDQSIWVEDNSSYLDINNYIQKSGVAFIASSVSSLEIKSLDSILLKTDSDLVIVVIFDQKKYITFVYFYTKDEIIYKLLHGNITSLKFYEETQFILIDPVDGSYINSKHKI